MESVERFLENYMAEVETEDHRERNELAVDRRANSAAHALRKARAVFARDKMELYKGLTLPDLSGFVAAARLPVTLREHKAIPPETIAAIDEAAKKLLEEDKRLWLVHTCLKHLALRPKELFEAQMHWLRESAWGQWFFAVVVTANSPAKGLPGVHPPYPVR